MELVLDIAGDQIDGARDYQEDAFLVTYLGDDEGGDSKASALVVMADGMGGHAAGNIASNLVVQTFNRTFSGSFGKSEASPVLSASLLKANGALAEAIKETPALDGMGCTMVTACFSRGKVYWVSVGDSHLYLVRNKELNKKNTDHSYGGYLDRMKAQGVDVEAEPGLSRNMLMSAMTGEEIAEIDCPEHGFDLDPGDRLIVSSDGLDSLTPGTILQTTAWAKTARECVAGLLKAVEDAKKPRQDNTTVIVVDVVERESAPPPPPPVEEAPQPAAAPAAEAHEPEPEPEPEPSQGKGGGKGATIAIALAVLAAAGAGGFFFMQGGDKGADPAPMVTEAPAEKGGTEAAPESAEPEPAAPEPAATPEPAEAPETAAAQPAPVVEVAPVPPAEREFRDDLASGGQGPVMVRIPGGRFTMGSAGHSVEADERPAHEVTVAPFAISKYELTFADYERFVKATGRAIPDNMYLDKNSHPAVFVSWDDAYALAQWLSKETGQRYRLPSEAEWEYAAAAGTDTPYWWGFDIDRNRAHCFDCKTGLNPRTPTEIGRFEANPFGLHDTSGNVAEWVHDCYHPNYDGAPRDGSVWEGGDCASRVARGGSYSSTSKSLRAASRSKWRSTQGYDSIGVRVVREVGP